MGNLSARPSTLNLCNAARRACTKQKRKVSSTGSERYSAAGNVSEFGDAGLRVYAGLRGFTQVYGFTRVYVGLQVCWLRDVYDLQCVVVLSFFKRHQSPAGFICKHVR